MTTPPTSPRCPFAPDADCAAPIEGVANEPTGGAESTDPGRSTPVRWGLAGTGFLCVALGGLGTVVPGLPTTIFLIIASWCFTRSCPWLDERMRASRIFAPYVRFLDPDVPMPARTRVMVLALLWLFAGGSAIGLAMNDLPAAAAITVLAGLAGTVMVLRWRRAETTASV